VKLFLVTFSVNVMHMSAVGWVLSLLLGPVVRGFHFLIFVAEISYVLLGYL